MDDLLIEYRTADAAIQRTVTNFKKIGKANVTRAVAQNRLTILKETWMRCVKINTQLEKKATPEQHETHEYFVEQSFLVTEDAYLAASDFITNELQRVSAPAGAPAAVNLGDTSVLPVQNEHSAVIQLPRIDLPKFSGDYLEWDNFRDLFESLIVANHALTNVQRLHYLKASLTGEASQLLKNVSITEANYESSWTTLKSRYDNRRVIITAHLQSFTCITPMTSESVKELKLLRDKTNEAITALKNLERPVSHWDDLLVFLTVQKLDARSCKEWEMSLGSKTEYPTYKELDTFLANRIRALESMQLCNASYASGKQTSNSLPKAKRPSTFRAHVSTVAAKPCLLCNASHSLAQCAQFKAKSPDDRRAVAKEHRCCFNCLKPGHMPRNCQVKQNCSVCHRRHHTLIHTEQAEATTVLQTSSTSAPSASASMTQSSGDSIPTSVTVMTACETPTSDKSILLATAWVTLRNKDGGTLTIRALLDQGSESSFVTESAVQLLRAPRRSIHATMVGIGGQPAGTVRSMTSLTVSPIHNNGPYLAVDALILKKLTSYVPRLKTDVVTWSHIRDLQLADPNPGNPAPIDMILGADLYGLILRNGLRVGSPGTPVAQNTVFGWILSGLVSTGRDLSVLTTRVHHCSSADDLGMILNKFWDLEELPGQTHLTEDEKACDSHFVATHTRIPKGESTDGGRYVVRLPFKDGPPIAIGESANIATKLYAKLENRLARDQELESAYCAFMDEYRTLGHMEPVATDAEQDSNQIVYLPHHPVVRPSSTTTRLRVVFNASCPTSNGTTLNNHQHTGPKLQRDLSEVVLRWRQHQYVYTADVQKMYRQIRVHPDDTDYQRIIWRSPCDQTMTAYRLCTVTYGTASAPYLALRVLKQLARDERENFPVGAQTLENDFYVDDVLFGADEIIDARNKRFELTQILASAGFQLHKWSCSDPRLLDDGTGSVGEHALRESEDVKLLGLVWNPETDAFKFNVNGAQPTDTTKRSVLSVIARLFDPLGWLSPFVIIAKMLMQELWIRGGDWNNPIPDDLLERWREYCEQMLTLTEVTIPRWTGQGGATLGWEIHGFADASSRAYAAVVYLRVLKSMDSATVTLLIAKTKVAPIKPVSIPRLELCAAALLARVIEHVQRSMNLSHAPVYGWSDSTVVLAWLSQHPSKWQTFVANRVADIHTRLPKASWRHVPTADNPADCATRGLGMPEFAAHALWFEGPEWLRRHSTAWPARRATLDADAELEMRPTLHSHTVQQDRPEWSLPHDVSSWPRLLRITAYCYQFIERVRSKQPRAISGLTLSDLDRARRFWITYVQGLSFKTELQLLRRGSPLPATSSLRRLCPELDNSGLLRVGGRLANSHLQYNEKHPIILPRHRVTDLIVSQAHLRALHGGTQLTLRILRQDYWIVGARVLVKSTIHRCVTCVRERATTAHQKMADLPESRTTPSRPFSHSGVDYAGPVLVRSSKGRGHQAHKGYIALFICLSTRAIHLELVGDYTSAGFLAAFKRFTSRRGMPSDVYSDNGTTFQGADKELRAAFRCVMDDPELRSELVTDGTTWHFLPPAAPHFGGVWEAGVKSMKHHLRRVLGNHTLNVEEFNTLLCQIEACLNSRPIAPMSDDPNDLTSLTPGHFLIGAPLVSVPEPSVLHLNENRLDRWQTLHRMREQFWRRWSTEYLHTLQQRYKWNSERPELRVGDLVLIKHETLPPSKWLLGRIVQCHPGADGHVRVVTIKTARSQFKRPITQVCVLPVRTAT